MPDSIRTHLEAIRDRNAKRSDRGRTINEINDEADAVSALEILDEAEKTFEYDNSTGGGHRLVPDPVGVRDAKEPA